MGSPLGVTTAKVSILESYAQPNAVRTAEVVAPSSCDCAEVDGTAIRKRPSIIIGGDSSALAAVRVIHSPKASTAASPSSAGGSIASPRVRGAWRRKIFGSGWTGPTDAVLSVAGLIITIMYYCAFLRWNETRSDVSSRVSLSDPVLRHLPSIDFSRILSVLVYGSLLAAWKYAYKKPDLFLEFVQTHAIVMWVRMFVLYLTPLEAPDGSVPLVDPIAYPDGVALVRDLFFSGHTATTFGLFICTRRNDRLWKLTFGVVSLVTASLVLVQKAHYTVDVVAAPFFVHTTHSCVLHLRHVLARFWARQTSPPRLEASTLRPRNSSGRVAVQKSEEISHISFPNNLMWPSSVRYDAVAGEMSGMVSPDRPHNDDACKHAHPNLPR